MRQTVKNPKIPADIFRALNEYPSDKALNVYNVRHGRRELKDVECAIKSRVSSRTVRNDLNCNIWQI